MKLQVCNNNNNNKSRKAAELIQLKSLTQLTSAINQASEATDAQSLAPIGKSFQGFCLHGLRPQSPSAFSLKLPLIEQTEEDNW
jgi:hypothetical protein